MKTKAMPVNDQLTQAGERAFQEEYEKFKRESFEHLSKQREAKEQRDKKTEQSAESAKQMSGT